MFSAAVNLYCLPLIMTGALAQSTSQFPSSMPTQLPSNTPSLIPTTSPTVIPSDEPTLIPSSFPSKKPTLLPTSLPTGDSYLDYTFDVDTNEITIEYHFDPSLTWRYIAVYDASVIQDVSQSYVNSQSFWSSSKCKRQLRTNNILHGKHDAIANAYSHFWK